MSDFTSTGDAPKEVAELRLHYLWKEQKLDGAEAFVLDGRALKIIFPGWYNRGWGPDFKDAKIQAGEEILFGDVEIHLEESSWYKHKHHEDERYNKVILHVFLTRSERRARNLLGVPVSSFCLRGVDFEWSDPKDFSSPQACVKELPGACGLFLTPDKYRKVKSLIFQASEQRLLDKSAPFAEALKGAGTENQENILFSSMCKYLGYSAFAESFLEMSRVYPYSEIVKFFRSLHRESRVEILGRWLGFANILDSVDSENLRDELRREWLLFRELWEKTGNEPFKPPNTPRYPGRPFNNPLRRLNGLYYHLEKVHFHGLIKSWLKFFGECGRMLEDKPSLRKLNRLLAAMFPRPEWDVLNYFLTADSKKKMASKVSLIGPQRQLIILANSLLPFFLAWARFYNDRDLEKTLFALFLILPNEGTNHKTRFMERRLFQGRSDFKVKKNLSYHQGLIQLHDDCCRSFYEGCGNCSLIKMIKARP